MLKPSQKLRIIVGGMVGQFPLGGVAWDYLHYVIGLHELGHDVYYHDDTWVWPLNPVLGYPEDKPDHTVEFFRNFFARHCPQLQDHWYYAMMHETGYGMTPERFDEVARTADVYINVSGACFMPDNLNPRCIRVFLDTDPGYNQIILRNRPSWSANVERWYQQVRAHDRHLTYAENIHQPDCKVPKMDFDWRTTRCVVTLPQWEMIRNQPPPAGAPLSTVMTWKYFNGPVELNGVHYHGKAPEHEKFHDLPSRVSTPMLLAVAGEKYDEQAIKRDGWRFTAANPVTLTAEDYQRFIRDSVGEWSVAKNVYVALRTGWFSCRTACYLAAGRPAIVQDTAWSKFIPSGQGVIGFSTMEEAISAIHDVMNNYPQHRAAAYEMAEQYLTPQKVLAPMIEQIFRSAAPTKA
jgi:hypothetical protein